MEYTSPFKGWWLLALEGFFAALFGLLPLPPFSSVCCSWLPPSDYKKLIALWKKRGLNFKP